MGDEALRSTLDQLGEEDLLRLRDEVRAAPDGSLHEIGGVEVPKDRALMLINQALPVQEG